MAPFSLVELFGQVGFFAIVFLICGVISVILQRWAEQRL